MPKFAVPVWIRQRAMMMVEAETAQEATAIVREKVGTVTFNSLGADINNGLKVDSLRRGPIKELSPEDVAWTSGYGNGGIDNDKGVPFEDYGPNGPIRDERYQK